MTINLLSGGDLVSNCCTGVALMIFVTLFFMLAGWAWRTGTLSAEHEQRGKQTKDEAAS